MKESDIPHGTIADEIEVMCPVGSWESLRGAIQGGADSIYFGVQGLNMRAASSVNFSLDDLSRIVAVCRSEGIKTYLTLNTVLFDEDIPYMRQVVDRAAAEGVDAVIVADQAAMNYARAQGVEVHISTQLNVSNTEAVAFYAQYADVVVLARELTLDRVRHICDQIAERDIRGPRGERVRIEMFVHGALCMATSGKCYLSLHEAWKSANRGECRQLCRRSYRVEDVETGTRFVVENEHIMSPKDLCTIEFLDRMIEAGVRVLKIEGRARSGEYVRRVCECYKAGVRAVAEGRFSRKLGAELKERLRTVFNRDFWDGYYLGQRLGEWSEHYGSAATVKKVMVGRVVNYFKRIGVAEVSVEAVPLAAGEKLLFLGATTGAIEFVPDEIRVNLVPTELAAQGTNCSVRTPEPVHRGDKVFKLVEVPRE
ncbi:MAG: U32 family peptidase [Rikenella sp.]|nr:U32 family peptidase [Rikenella sp.]